MNILEEFTSNLRKSFIHFYYQNSLIEDHKITPAEEDLLNLMPNNELLISVSSLFQNLIDFKKLYFSQTLKDSVEQSELLEKLLQKSESEVRSHIRTIHQQKLHIETIMIQIDESKIKNKNNINDIKKLQEKINSLEKQKNNKKILEKIQILEDQLRQKDEKIRKIELEFSEYKHLNKCDTDKNLSPGFRRHSPSELTLAEPYSVSTKIKKFSIEKPIRALREKYKPGNDLSKSLLFDKLSKKTEKFHYRSISDSTKTKSLAKHHQR